MGQPKPAKADPDGSWYTFEKGAETSEDRKGWADVWMRSHFGWEYKGIANRCLAISCDPCYYLRKVYIQYIPTTRGTDAVLNEPEQGRLFAPEDGTMPRTKLVKPTAPSDAPGPWRFASAVSRH